MAFTCSIIGRLCAAVVAASATLSGLSASAATVILGLSDLDADGVSAAKPLTLFCANKSVSQCWVREAVYLQLSAPEDHALTGLSVTVNGGSATLGALFTPFEANLAGTIPVGAGLMGAPFAQGSTYALTDEELARIAGGSLLSVAFSAFPAGSFRCSMCTLSFSVTFAATFEALSTDPGDPPVASIPAPPALALLPAALALLFAARRRRSPPG